VELYWQTSSIMLCVICTSMDLAYEDLLIFYNGLKLAHEASITKKISCEPHLDISTTLNQNAILPCASPSNLSRHNIWSNLKNIDF
jgi:hypothetical protein